eukprot:gene47172-63194_t
MQHATKRPPVGMPGGMGGQHMDVHAQALGASHAPQAAHQGHVVDVRRRQADRLAGLGVAQQQRLHRRFTGDRGLQQVGVEMQQPVPGAGGAFREDRQRLAPQQRGIHLVHHAHRVALALALDEQRAGALDQPAQQRPVQHVRLGDETRMRRRGLERQDVQPGDVVGDEQRGPRPRLAMHLHLQAQALQRGNAEPPDALVPPGFVQRMEAQCHHAHGVHQVQHRERNAPQRARVAPQ